MNTCKYTRKVYSFLAGVFDALPENFQSSKMKAEAVVVPNAELSQMDEGTSGQQESGEGSSRVTSVAQASARFKCSRSPRQTRRRRASLCARIAAQSARDGSAAAAARRSARPRGPACRSSRQNARCLECSRTTRTSRPFFSMWSSQVLALILIQDPCYPCV